MKRSLLWVLLLASPVCAAPGSTTDSTTTMEDAPVAPEGDIRVLVRQAMGQARNDDPANLDKVEGVALRSAEALPYLESYSHSNNDGVRDGVATIASATHSRLALRLLSNVFIRPESLERSNMGNGVIEAMARYSPAELSLWGGRELQDRLMAAARRNGLFWQREALSAIFLLPSFRSARTTTFLRALARQPASVTKMPAGLLPLAPRPFAANLMLANMGEDAAFERLKAQLAKNQTNERVWLCRSLTATQNKKLLALAAPLLDDQRPVQNRTMYVMQKQGDKLACVPKILPPLRVCDVAMGAVYKKVGERKWSADSIPEVDTAEEIARMRTRLAALLLK